MSRIPIRHGHLFCGLGGGAKGFNRATARVRQLTAEVQCAAQCGQAGAA